MPLNEIQKHVLSVLRHKRCSESHVAGGAVINRDVPSPRFSADLDFFHDRPEIVQRCAEEDVSILSENGYSIEWELRTTSAWRARICRGDESLRLVWCNNSPFRFFPVQQDAVFGYCLHQADVATNKILAIAGRSEIRDYIDALFLNDTYLHLGALLWAACDKDKGFTPDSLLHFARKNMRFREDALIRERLAAPLSLVEIKSRWLAVADSAQALIAKLPPREIGCLYLNASGLPVTPDPEKPAFTQLIRHFGSIGGSLPSVMNIPTSESR